MQVEVDLDGRFLSGVFGLRFILEQGEQQKEDGAFAGADEVMKQVLFARQNAADALGLEFGIGCLHRGLGRAQGGMGRAVSGRAAGLSEQL